MKTYKILRNIMTMATVLFSCFVFCQAQKQYINYQGVARDASNEIMASQTISIGISLRFGSPTATVLYSETHNTVTTDPNGVFSLQIGTGTVNSGIYTDLEWGQLAPYATITLNGTDVGTVELQSVPYANASGKATKMELNDLTNVGGSPTDGQVLKFDGTSWLPSVDDGSLWTEAGNNIYYNSGEVSIGDPFAYAKLNVNATTDDTPISISSRNSYSGDAAVVGITNEVFGDGGGSKTGFSSLVGNGDGTKYGYISSIDQNGGVLTSNSDGFSSTIKK